MNVHSNKIQNFGKFLKFDEINVYSTDRFSFEQDLFYLLLIHHKLEVIKLLITAKEPVETIN